MKNHIVKYEKLCRAAAASLTVLTPSDIAALEILKETGINVVDAALVARSAIKPGAGE